VGSYLLSRPLRGLAGTLTGRTFEHKKGSVVGEALQGALFFGLGFLGLIYRRRVWGFTSGFSPRRSDSRFLYFVSAIVAPAAFVAVGILGIARGIQAG
jgi:hypothetical protein